MFLRKIIIHKDGKPHYYWALVESVRTERGLRQHVVSYLGDMDAASRIGVEQAAEGYPPIQESLFDETTAEKKQENTLRHSMRQSYRTVCISLG